MEEATKVEAKSAAEVKAAWREMSINNIDSLVRVADKIHPDLPESDQVFAERVKLFPEGCLTLVEGEGDEPYGYVISHPIRRRQPPALNSLLGEIASDADQYYIHDLAILPKVEDMALLTSALTSSSLSLNDTRRPVSFRLQHGPVLGPFWIRAGGN